MATPTDQQRFRALYDRHHPAITAYFVRRIGSQDAADAADDVLAVAWRRRSRVPEEPETLRWLCTQANSWQLKSVGAHQMAGPDVIPRGTGWCLIH